MNADIEHFGISLRRAREDRALSLGEISSSTKVPRSTLALIEAGELTGLPADVFVRGFIRSYARAVGVSELQPLAQYDRALRARSEAARAESSMPVVDPTIAGIAPEGLADRLEDAEAAYKQLLAECGKLARRVGVIRCPAHGSADLTGERGLRAP